MSGQDWVDWLIAALGYVSLRVAVALLFPGVKQWRQAAGALCILVAALVLLRDTPSWTAPVTVYYCADRPAQCEEVQP